MANRLTLKILEREEGWSATPYYCSEGYPTVGFGFKIGDKYAPLPSFTLPRIAGEAWLSALVSELEVKMLPQFTAYHVNEARQAIILSMCYQLGFNGCFGFTNMWEAISTGDWELAADEALDSKWAKKDTPERAERHAKVLRTGTTVGVYL